MLVIAAIAVGLSLVTTGACARLGRRLEMLDVPSERSSHVAPVPRSGGVGLFAAWLLALGALAVLGRLGSEGARAWDPYLLPAAAYFGIGLLEIGRASCRERVYVLV